MKKLVGIMISVVLILIIAFFSISCINTTKQNHDDNLKDQLSQHLKDAEYSVAFNLYNNQDEENKIALKGIIDSFEAQLCAEAWENLELEKIAQYQQAGGQSTLVNETIERIENKLEELKAANNYYVQGLSYYLERQFDSAKDCFEQVISEDANYESALAYLDKIAVRDESWESNILGRCDYHNACCFDGEYIYVPYELEGVDGIYKIDKQGRGVDFFPLSDEEGILVISGINEVGEYLYFIAGENVGSGYTFDAPYCIYEMKKDGTDLAVVKEGNFTNLLIKGNLVYAVSREFGLVEYDKNFEKQKIICCENVVEFDFDEEGIYYTVQGDLTHDSDNTRFFYDGEKAELLDKGEYLHMYMYDEKNIKLWQFSSSFDKLTCCGDDDDFLIEKAEIRTFYGVVNNKAIYTCVGIAGDESYYIYDLQSKKEQVIDELDLEIIGVLYEENKLIVKQDGKLYFSNDDFSEMQEIVNAYQDKNALEYNGAVIKHIQDEDLYTATEDETVISVIKDKQIWHYKDDSLNIIIEKRYVQEYDTNIYVTHVFIKDYSLFTTGNANTESTISSHSTSSRNISNLYGMIYAQNTDTFTYEGNSDKGMIFRHGELVREVMAEDMIVYFDDGSMEVYRKDDNISGQTLLDMGASTSFSFGPILLEDYKINPLCASCVLTHRNPRSAIGYVEPGHYVMVVCDGRDNTVSRGLYMIQLAEVFKDEGCSIAYNLDGGMTSIVMFLGNYVNYRPPSNESEWSYYRPIAEMFYFGSSDCSPSDLYEYECTYNYFVENYR